MKKIVLTFCLIAGMGAKGWAQQLPNVGFNNWKGSGNAGSTYQSSGGSLTGGSSSLGLRQRPGDEPTDWFGSSINQQVVLGKKQELIYKKTDNENTYAQLKNTYVGAMGIGSNAPAYLTFGTPWVYAVSPVSECDGGTYGGKSSFSWKPDAIRGRFKKTAADKAEPSYIIVYLWNGTFTSQIKSSSSNDADRLKDDVDRAILGSVSATGIAEPSRVTNRGKLIAWCNQAFKNTTTSDSDWNTITVELNYVEANINEVPTKMNVVISAGDYWNRDNIQDGTTLDVDDVEFVFYSELASGSYNGNALVLNDDGTIENVDEVYAEQKISLTSNGHGATIEKSYDEETAQLTITVKGEDISVNPSNFHTYTIQFKKPLAKGDVNGDGQVTIADVTALVNIILGKSEDELGMADVNGDGPVTIADVTALVNIILGK